MIRDILKTCGYPERTIVLDAETYFDADYTLRKLPHYPFVTDDRFELLGWAIKRDDKPAEFKLTLQNIRWNQVTVIMHNAPFDALILAHHHGIYPPFIIDTLDLARHIEPRWRNDLATLCKRHHLPDKGNTGQFKGLHQADLDGATWLELVKYATNDAEQTYALFNLLFPKLSNPEFELRLARYTRDLSIKPTLHFSMSRAEKLKVDMQAEMQGALDQIGMTGKEVRGEASFKQRLQEVLGDTEPPMKQGKLKPILAIAKTDPGYSYLLNHPNDQVRELMEARVAAKSWPGQIKRVEKLQTIFTAAGKLPIPLKYYGAHTGRWSGDQGVNPHNFTARGHVLANQTRTLIEAPSGHTLLIGDFCQIEARVLDLFAEQRDMVQAFRDGRQVYCEFASKLFGHRVRKPRKNDDPFVAAWHGHRRTFGKVGILGAGYGMGADRCMDYAKNTYKIELTLPEAERLIKFYRQTHKNVVAYWYKVEKAFIRATLNSPQIYELSYGTRFYREANMTVIQLPSGRKLYYTGAKIEGSTRYPDIVMPDPRKTGAKLRMWGGYLVENIVQAASRDILAEAILKIEELGLRIPMTVHDDMSVVLPVSEVETYQPQIEAIARTPPAWAPDLPVDIEVKISRRYVK